MLYWWFAAWVQNKAGMAQRLAGLLDALRETADYQRLVTALSSRQAGADLNVARSARPFLLAALAQDWRGPLVYLTSAARRAYNVSEQLPLWLDEPERLHRFAESSAHFYDRAPWDLSVIRNRIAALSALAKPRGESPPIVVASMRALMQKTVPLGEFQGATIELRQGERIQMESLILRWIGMGYEPAPLVIEPGSFSRRGGILDIFPLASEHPLRIEFFDDEIDSLRRFDPADQRSIRRIESASICPAREALPRVTGPVGGRLERWSSGLGGDAEEVSSAGADIESLKQGSAFPCLEHYLPYLYGEPASLLDYAGADALILVEERQFLEESALEMAGDAEINREEAESTHQIAPEHPLPYWSWSELERRLGTPEHGGGIEHGRAGDAGVIQAGRALWRSASLDAQSGEAASAQWRQCRDNDGTGRAAGESVVRAGRFRHDSDGDGH